MSLTKKLICLSITMSFLSGCGVELVDDSQENKAPASESPVQSAPSQITLTPAPEPNRYQLNIPAEKGSIVNVRVIGSQAKVAKDGFSTQGLEGGLEYEIELSKNGQFQMERIRVPRDLVLTGLMEVPESDEVWLFETEGRIFLESSLHLVFKNRPLFLRANEVVARGALLQSFEANSIAAANEVGLNGGDLTIEAKKISGKLSIILQGQRGGKGSAGAAVAGRAATGTSYTGGNISNNCNLVKLGGQGKQGRKGNKGSRGGAGGDSGSLFLKVQDQEGLKLDFKMLEGEGGFGGDGGPGQRGGEGGFSGGGAEMKIQKTSLQPTHAGWDLPKVEQYVCQPERGPEGLAGEPGDTGEPGRRGNLGKYCRLKSGQMNCE